MTKEEIAQYIKSELASDDTEIYLDIDDYKIIVKALEQESVLDKIRAEIDELRKAPLISWASSEMIIDTILEILDKYKAESEG